MRWRSLCRSEASQPATGAHRVFQVSVSADIRHPAHDLSDISKPLPQVAGDLAPVGMGPVAVRLGEDGLHDGAGHRLVGLAREGLEVALELHATALPPGAQNQAW